jgi:hypothetical protein
MRPSVALERVALGTLLGVHPRHFKHIIVPRSFDIASGATNDITISIPRDANLLLTNITLEGYPKDAGGGYVMPDRNNERAPFDTVTFLWTLNGVAQNVAQEYRFFRGNIFKPFATGKLVLTVAYTSIGAAVAQRLYFTANGYIIPNTAAGTEALNEVLAQMEQSAQGPGSIL